MVTIKRCTKCGEEKELSEFPKRKDAKSGYRNTCNQCVTNWNKQFYQDHKQERKEYRNANKNKINEYVHNRRVNDEQYRLAANLRCRVYYALNGKAKSTNTLNLLGCSAEHLHYWLTSQLQDNQKLSDMEPDHLIPFTS